MQELVFVIGDGQVDLEAKGFKGSACEAAAKAFEDALGGKISDKKLKPEFYEKAPDNRLRAGSK